MTSQQFVQAVCSSNLFMQLILYLKLLLEGVYFTAWIMQATIQGWDCFVQYFQMCGNYLSVAIIQEWYLFEEIQYTILK